jgi:2-C-methyl-D-erythritol 4-phosphate cytidylyltransferase
VLPISHFQYWQTLVQKHKFDIHHTLVAGGETRFQSVKNGINSLQNIDLVAIHDGVRPFVSPSIIKNSFQLAAQKGSAIAAVPSKDSLRLVQKDGSSQALDRTLCYLMQTPQVFQYPIISKALQQPELPIFTDDASVVEYDGVQVYLSEGSYQNIKITTKEDLILAEALIKNGY